MDIHEIRREVLRAAVSRLSERGNRAALGRRYDVDATYISQLLNGHRNMGEKAARSLEVKFGLEQGHFDDPANGDIDPARWPGSEPPNLGKSPRPGAVWNNEDELDPSQYLFVPRLDMSVPCGDGKPMFQIDEKGQRQAFRLAYLQRIGANPATIATVTAEGQSMWPRIIHDDSLTIDYSKNQVQDDAVFVFVYRDNWFIKRLFRNPAGGLRVVSDNPDKSRYPDWFIEAEQMTEFQVIAKVLAVSGIIE